MEVALDSLVIEGKAGQVLAAFSVADRGRFSPEVGFVIRIAFGRLGRMNVESGT